MADNTSLADILASIPLSDEDKASIAKQAMSGNADYSGDSGVPLTDGQMGPPQPLDLGARQQAASDDSDDGSSSSDDDSSDDDSPPQGQQQASPQNPLNSLGGSALASFRLKTPINTSVGIGKVPAGTDQGTVADLMAKLSGQSDPALQAALQNRNQLQLFGLLGKASNQILGGETHTKPSDAVFDSILQNADQGVKDIGTKNSLLTDKMKQLDTGNKLLDDQNKNDPNSSISNLYRASAQKMLGPGTKLPDNMSAADLDKISPIFERLFQAQQSSLDRSARLQESNNWKQNSLDSRIENQANNRFDKNTQDFTQRLEGAKRFSDIIDKINSGQIVDTQSLSRTLTTDLSNLVGMNKTGGAYGDREEYAINTFQGLISKLGQYIGKPISAIPPQYLQQLGLEGKLLQNDYIDTYKRKSNELQAGTKFQVGKDVVANRTKSFLDQYQNSKSPDINTPNNTTSTKPYDQDVMDYANKYHITNDAALALKNARSQEE